MEQAVNIEVKQLPREMMEHTYPILREVEETHWWYVGRRRILSEFVAGAVRDVKDRKPQILDVGCGTGGNVVMLNEHGEAYGIDVSKDAVQFCHERGLERVELGAADELPFEGGKFDLVTALDVVEHLDDDLGALKEFHRVVRPGGKILIFVPTFMFLWGIQDDVSNHRRRYRLPELLRIIREAGFEVERSSYANITFFMPVLVIRTLMRWFKMKADTELGIGLSALNKPQAWLFGAERFWLRHLNIPFGVSALCVARRKD
jgi:SAM-dependent methyltransferase